jgi:hypothetical protein
MSVHGSAKHMAYGFKEHRSDSKCFDISYDMLSLSTPSQPDKY